VKDVLRKLAIPFVFLLIALPAGVGVVMAMGDPEDTTTEEQESAFTPITRSGEPRNERHAQPRWEMVTRFAGSGSAERSFEIADGAIQ
jgi:hypothetical protein